MLRLGALASCLASASSGRALAPSLRWLDDDGGAGGSPPPLLAGIAAAEPGATQPLFVDCEKGSDAAGGTSASAAVRTLARAQQLVRTLRQRRPEAGVTVTVLSGVCELGAPLLLTDADSGASDAARVVWRGQGATISGGAAPASWPPPDATAAGVGWQSVRWPGAPPAAAVWSLDINAWPIPIKTLRTVRGDWVPRSPWPKRAASFTRPSLPPTNYSEDWLSIDPSVSSNGNNTVLPAVAQIGLRPHCADGVCVSDILRRPSAHLAGEAEPACATAPVHNHSTFLGAAIKLQTVAAGSAGLAACRAACCANPLCRGWSVAEKDCDPGGAMAPCVQGKPCCWQSGDSPTQNITRIHATCVKQ